jgi:beta-N-acetylhexosaminidase
MKKKISFPVLAVLMMMATGFSQLHAQDTASVPVFQKALASHWVDSVFNTLSKNEKIAQLLFVAAYSNRGVDHEVAITDLIRKYKIGGLIFFQGTPQKQALLTNFYQSQSKVPLMMAIDGEWGLAMRLKHTIHFPYQMALGAVKDNRLIYEMGREIGRELKRVGVQMNLAPVVDINNNPNNPVINFRSFGMDKRAVAAKGIAYMRGMQDAGILATAKHFPGHGDVDADSHKTLPVVPFNRQRLDTLELYPFRQMIRAGVGAVMAAHLYVPALDSTPHLPSSLSKKIITGLLKDSLGFKGLVISDAMNMKGVTNYFPAGEADAKAMIAGNDILEFVQDVPLAIKKIRKAIKAGKISWKDIDQRCKKVLAAKYWTGLNHWQPIDTTNLLRDLNPSIARVLNRKLIRASLTVLRDSSHILPVQNLDTERIATLAIGSDSRTEFQKMLANYTRTTDFYWTSNDTTPDSIWQARLKGYSLVIIGITHMSQYPQRNFGITPDMLRFLQYIISSHRTIVTVFGNPFSLDKMPGIEKSEGLVLTYEDNSLFQNLAAQLIFGAFGAQGALPVRLSKFPLHFGIKTQSLGRLAYTLPEEEGMNSVYLNHVIDSIAEEGIAKKAYPGCEVLVARNGAVVFHKTYGFHTYYNRVKTEKNDLFDFASLTKVTASTPAVMKLYDEGKVNLDIPFDRYWPSWKHSNKSQLTLREILAHQAGLQPWIPFWKKAVKMNGKFKRGILRCDSSSRFEVAVSPGIWRKNNYQKKIFKEIKKSPVSEIKKYRYSGLFFFLAPQWVKNMTGEDFQSFLKKNFYHPLGAYNLTFNPYKNHPLVDIVPTEVDTIFRHWPIHGYVHDEGAAMMGGISGNAGLFGTANDLAKLAQMYLQMGYFAGRQYILDTTMREFTRCQYPDNGNRRGLGFDKPLLGNDTLPEAKAYPAKSASPQSFGHSGFTGTFMWIDPKEKLVYIFFSNRVYPTRADHEIYKLNIRTSIQQALYNAIEKEKKSLLPEKIMLSENRPSKPLAPRGYGVF